MIKGKIFLCREQDVEYTYQSRFIPICQLTKNADGFIKFELVEKKPKTEVWKVSSKDNIELGIIKWYPAWRHYCFFPSFETIFSDRCQLAIGLKILELNKEHKEKIDK